MRAQRRYPPRSVGGLRVRTTYRIEGYACGDFLGELLSVDLDLARVFVTDTLRPPPRVKDRCPFPDCIRKDFHEGEHGFATIRLDAIVFVPWRCAKWTALPRAIAETSSTTEALRHGEKCPAASDRRDVVLGRSAARQLSATGD